VFRNYFDDYEIDRLSIRDVAGRGSAAQYRGAIQERSMGGCVFFEVLISPLVQDRFFAFEMRFDF